MIELVVFFSVVSGVIALAWLFAWINDYRLRAKWPDPTPEMLASPQFEAIWQCIKRWDINVPGIYSGYCGANGNHVRAILDALTAAAEVGEQTKNDWLRRESDLIAQIERATIERCAQVADEKAAEIEAWSHQDTASRLAAEMLRKAAAAIRALKDQDVK